MEKSFGEKDGRKDMILTILDEYLMKIVTLLDWGFFFIRFGLSMGQTKVIVLLGKRT